MKKIRIISNPYTKDTTFQVYDSDNNDWQNITIETDPNSKLISDEINKSFFPFKAKEIITYIVKEYGIGEDALEIVFKGTLDHFNEVEKICELLDTKCNITLTHDEVYLKNAHEVLPEIIEVFKKLRPIIDLSEENKDALKYNLDKFSDSSADRIPLCVIGNYSSGKSTFINALIGKEILPSGDEPMTAKIFKIHQMDNDKYTYLKFQYMSNDIQILIMDQTYEIIGNRDALFLEQLRSVLDTVKADGPIKCTNSTIFFLNKEDGKKISPIIEVGTSFNGGIWEECNNKFIILDTPGSNSATNISHSEVLDEALKGLTNGLPLYVSEINTLDSTDNLSLYNKIKEMKEIDSRFTMIVVNKADGADLPEGGRFDEEKESNLLNMAIPKNMYSIGIYFVSSIMGLGSKSNGEFTNKHSARVFRTQRPIFEDEDDWDYTCLYNYNIMPDQIKVNSVQKCKECKDNLLYANSGLYAIEHGIQNFASKYSSYNKCQQSLLYLENVIRLINNEIDQLQVKSKVKKKELEDSLDEEKNKLRQNISTTGENRRNEYLDDGYTHIKDYTKQNTPSITRKDLVDLEEDFTSKQRSNLQYSRHDDKIADAKDSLKHNFIDNVEEAWHKKDLSSVSKIFTESMKDIGNVADSYIDKNNTRISADKYAAQNLIDQVQNDFKFQSAKFLNNVNLESRLYWNGKTESIRKELAKIVLGSAALDDNKKTELAQIIMNYQDLVLDVEDVHLFKIEDFKAMIGSEKLNKVKLTYVTNRLFNEFSKYIFVNIYESHSQSFEMWLRDLLNIIHENIVSYNPVLSELQKRIIEETNKIQELEMRQTTVKNNMNYIRSLMEWQEF